MTESLWHYGLEDKVDPNQKTAAPWDDVEGMLKHSVVRLGPERAPEREHTKPLMAASVERNGS